MSELAQYRKADLITLATEFFGLEIASSDTILKIIKKIESCEDFDVTMAISQIKQIQEERLEKFAEEKEKREREHELEKMRLGQINDTDSLASSSNERTQRVSLKNLMPCFDPETSDISLFLTLFQRHARKANIEENEWVTQLLPLMPLKIAELIIREPEAKLEDFQYVKGMLLDRFKLSPEAFRTKFISHTKQKEGMWKDLVFELRNYLEGWLSGLEIKTFESLQNLMITDQLKRRATPEMREHMIDSWSKFVDPTVLAGKFDEYEMARKPTNKSWGKDNEGRKSDRFKESENSRSDKKQTEKKILNWRDKTNDVKQLEKDRIFEKRKPPACYFCSSLDHLRPNCPKWKKYQAEKINHLGGVEGFGTSFAPYLSTAKINGIERLILRDLGAGVDLSPREFVRPDQFTGEIIWLKQPLENEVRCLPVARLELEIDNVGVIRTKAAVAGPEIDMKHYILGNQTQELIEEKRKQPELINAVVTRNQARIAEMENSTSQAQGNIESEENLENAEIRAEEDSELELPAVEPDKILDLVKVSSKQLIGNQNSDESLKGIREKAEKENSEFFRENGCYFRRVTDHHGNVRKQIIVPKIYRDKLLTLCHHGIAAHLGVTKTKGKLLRYFFWPNVVKDTEEFVRTCASCQIVGKAGDQKRAPLQLVPIITEVFSRLNIDLVGPLPPSEKGNKYILTSLCMSSKYPDAVPIVNIKSESVIEALLIIFSRTGFPKEIQCDLGTSFVSILTSTFFERFGIRVIHSSVHRPQTNPVERFHRTIKRLLKVLCLESGKDWERNLPYALLALRTITHDSTGFSPNELVFGKNLRTPETLIYEKWGQEQEEPCLVTEYIFELLNRLKRCQELAAEQMVEKRDKRKSWYDRGTVKREFKVGEQVLVLATSKPNKLAANWMGPGVVESKISETNYIVKLPGKKEKSQIYHINLLKPYHQRVELINVLIAENVNRTLEEMDLDIPYPSANPDVYNFEEIVRESDLTNRCTEKQIEQLKQLLDRHQNLFSNDPGRTDLIEHDIELISDKPVRLKPYRTSPRQTEILKREIKRMLELNIIVVGESDYTSPMVLVETPGRDPRPCIDYRQLNSVTRAEYFPLPNIEERVEKVAAAKFISIIDLTKGYWQIPLTSRAQRLAAFVTTFGCFIPLTMPFGLVNAPYRFSKFMDMMLRGMEEFCVPYLDDIAVFSENWEEHMQHLNSVLKKLKEAKLKIKPSKCQFARNEVQYLGHVVGNGRRTPAQAKIQAVLDFPTPQNKTQIRKILGMAQFYQKYIEHYASLVEPLTRALKGKNRKENVKWTPEMEQSFSELKRRLTQKPVLYAPDYKKEFIIQTDASNVGIGVVMAQREGDNEHPILYLSRKFTDPEKNFSTTEKECAAIIFAIKKLRHYLDGQKFVIESDHNPLVWLKNNAGNNQRLLRWSLALQPFDFKVVHRAGKNNCHADCLSRI